MLRTGIVMALLLVAGGAKGIGGAARERRQVLRTCLKERGYRVLN